MKSSKVPSVLYASMLIDILLWGLPHDIVTDYHKIQAPSSSEKDNVVAGTAPADSCGIPGSILWFYAEWRIRCVLRACVSALLGDVTSLRAPFEEYGSSPAFPRDFGYVCAPFPLCEHPLAHIAGKGARNGLRCLGTRWHRSTLWKGTAMR